MEEAIALVMGPLVMAIASRSFNYDIVVRHMKVKKRNSKKIEMPKEPIDENMATNVFNMSHIYPVDKMRSFFASMMLCPKLFHVKSETKTISKMMSRGQE